MAEPAAEKPRLHLDLPKPALIAHPIEHLWGWMAVTDRTAPVSAQVGAQVGAVALPCARIDRGGKGRIGFSIHLDLSGLPVMPSVDIMLRCGNDSVLLSLPVTAEAWVLAAAHLPVDWMLSARLEDKFDAVSSHLYAASSLENLNGFSEEQFILDAGAGLRKRPQRNVINLEIYDYPSTDILSTGQRLPCADNTFDAVLSIAELLHHGVPDGVNHPIQTLHRVATLDAAGLGAAREDFLNLSLRDLLATTAQELRRKAVPFVTELDEEAGWRLAYATSATFRKREGTAWTTPISG